MKIKRLEIVGFKSFVDKVSLDFQQGITGVVGPNGCGKSNIVDAIRWAMGEQNVRHLRGRAMEDIIFGGCETRKPHGMAQVSVVFDNSAGLCPPAYQEYAEIMITRRLFRSGDSEYLINKTPCRLLDVTELFMDTGVGARAYSIIEQGKVGMMLSAKPEELRVLIEEVAGVTKYKSRKKTALRKLDATNQNLVRISDLIAEVRRQMGALKRQAQKAERFRDLRAELKQIEVELSGNRFQKLLADIALVSGQERDEAGVLARLDGRLAEDELQLEERQLQLGRVEGEHREAQERVYQLGGEVQRVENELLLNHRQREHLAEQDGQLKSEIESAATQLKLLEEEYLELRGRDSLSDAEFDQLQEAVDAAEEALKYQQNRERELLHQLENGRSELMELVTHCSRLANRRDEIERRLRLDAERRKHIETDAEGIADQQSELRLRKEALQEQHQKLVVRQEGLREQVAEYDEQWQCIKRDLAGREDGLAELRQKLERQRSRQESLLELQGSMEGYAEGTRTLLEALGGREIFADLIRVPQELEGAVEAVLGERLQAVPLASDVVSGALEQLTRIQARAHLLVATPPFSVSGPQLGRPLLDLLQVQAGAGLVAQLLSGIFIVDNCREYLGVELGPGCVLVDAAGQCLDWRGLFSGGTATLSGGGLLRRQRQIGELEVEIQQLEADTKAVERDVDSLAETLLTLEEGKTVAVSELHRLELQLLDISKDRQGLQAEDEHLNKRLALIVFDLEQIEESGQSARTELEKFGEEICAANERQLLLERSASDLQAELAELREGLECSRENLVQQRLRLATMQQQQKAQRETMQRIDAQRDSLGQRRELLLARQAQGAGELQALAQSDQRLKMELDALLGRREAQQKTSDRLREGYEEQRALLDEFRDQSRRVRHEAEELRKRVAALQLRQRELELDAENIRQGILERYRVDLSEHQVPEANEVEVLRQQQLLKRLQDQIATLGDVNLMAIEEYQEQEQRYNFLSRQRDDLNQAMDDLQKAISQINRTTRRRFKETFELANEKFKQVFPRLFRGGQAELRLTNEDDLLETGIEIIVQPPGKRLQNVNLLSGGEKALTAVALIFSLFLIKPTPFCILDEVDAPLDDANIDRFADMVKEMTQQSQFIIITHSKRTMKVVDTMYGVTMQEPGISKLVSVRMNEAVA